MIYHYNEFVINVKPLVKIGGGGEQQFRNPLKTLTFTNNNKEMRCFPVALFCRQTLYVSENIESQMSHKATTDS